MSVPSSRRARLRHELTAAIKDTALRQLTDGGPQAVTLRGIARELEISPAAIYGYFSSLDDLYANVIADGFNALVTGTSPALDPPRIRLPAVSGIAAGLGRPHPSCHARSRGRHPPQHRERLAG